ncbi:hypothetical protein IG631_08062 [Alternaria alternata]|nr:hypothetical protein IG631_08062 [Alternaria alternata]
MRKGRSLEHAVKEVPLSSCRTCESIYTIHGRNVWDQCRGITYSERVYSGFKSQVAQRERDANQVESGRDVWRSFPGTIPAEALIAYVIEPWHVVIQVVHDALVPRQHCCSEHATKLLKHTRSYSGH